MYPHPISPIKRVIEGLHRGRWDLSFTGSKEGGRMGLTGLEDYHLTRIAKEVQPGRKPYFRGF